MTGTEKQWLDAKDIAERWRCQPRTVSAVMQRAGLEGLEVRPAIWMKKRHWTMEQVQAIERSRGVEGMFD